MRKFGDTMYFLGAFCLILTCFGYSNGISVSSYVTPADRLRFKKAFEDVWDLSNVNSVYYAVASHKVLNEPLPISEQDICQFLVKVGSESKNLEQLYSIAAIWKLLPSCEKIPPLSAADLNSKTELTYEDTFYLSYIKEYTGKNTSQTLKSVASLSRDETLVNVGYALHIANFARSEDAKKLFNKIEGIISHADEIDGQYLQYDGGLSVTALVVTGIYRLSETLNSPPPITSEQLIKFTNYFLSRLSVNRQKGIYYLLQALKTLVDNKFHMISSVDAVEKFITSEQPLLPVRVSNLFGQPLVSDKNSLSLHATSSDGKIKKINLTPTTESTVYTLNLAGYNLQADYYTYDINLSILEKHLDNKMLINPVNSVTFKITTKAVIDNFQFGVADPDHMAGAQLQKLEYPNKFKEKVEVDSLQRLVVRYTVKDAHTGKPMKIHQSFIKFASEDGKVEVVLVAAYENNSNSYKLYVDSATSGNVLKYGNGKYTASIIIGDNLITSPISFTFSDVVFKFPSDIVSSAPEDEFESFYKPKPEIKHAFREPEKRPPAIVSMIFSGLVLVPLLVLFVLWARLGVSPGNVRLSFSGLGFYAGLGGILGLYVLFWLQLNMFQTLQCLLGLGLITFLCGHKMLCSIASRNR